MRGDHRRLRGPATGAAEAGRCKGDRGAAADRFGGGDQRRHGRPAGALRPRLLRGLDRRGRRQRGDDGRGRPGRGPGNGRAHAPLPGLARRAARSRRGGDRSPPPGPGAGSGRLIFATGNRHKLRELRELLPGVELEPLPDFVTLPPEEGDSFAEIALAKARATHEATGRAVVADDSGISAVGLGGRPGIHSARYGGEGASDEENLEKLLREVAAAGEERRAYYTCALALIEEDGSEHVFEARWDGHLIEEPRGEGGFG